jgi:hypothetical protein
MDTGKIRYGKPLKLATLLLTSMIIAAASAAVYNYMYIEAVPISVEAAKIQFVTGDDGTAAGTSIGTNGTYASLTSMAGWPNATRVYEDPVRIKNMEAAGGPAHGFDLIVDGYSGTTTEIGSLVVKLYEGTTLQGTLTITAVGDSVTGLSIPANTEWRVQWEITWDAGAQSTSTVSVTLQVKVTS